MIEFKQPMLATAANLEKLVFPLTASPKLDGIRATVVNGRLLSRKLKPIPNTYLQNMFGHPQLEGLDGELIVGEPNDPEVYRNSYSGVMKKTGEPEATFHVFDHWQHPSLTFPARIAALRSQLQHAGTWDRIDIVEQVVVNDLDALLKYEESVLNMGYEGVMLRDPNSPYKFGRSTAKEGCLLKLKRFEDSEALILDVIEEMANLNEATTDERGYTKRSTHQENKMGKGRMGALFVRDLASGVEFQIGTGFDDRDRAEFWEKNFRGKIIKYKHFPIGVKDKPRFPVFTGMRSEIDL